MSKSIRIRVFKLMLSVLLIIFGLVLVILLNQKSIIKTQDKYVAGTTNKIVLYDSNYKKVLSISRGSKVVSFNSYTKSEDIEYEKIEFKKKAYFIKRDNLVLNSKDVVKEAKLYVRTSSTIYKDKITSKILSLVKKGEEVSIIGYDKLNKDGFVNKYKIKYKDITGYVYGKYLVSTKDESTLLYDKKDIQKKLAKMGNTLGGGTATNLDYYPYDKPKFKNNPMPSEVRALYLNSGVVKNIDEYIDFALNNNINAFVIDIKDNTSPAYNSRVMNKYSKTNYNHAFNDYETYKGYIQKAKNAGLYLIGRITTFKDSYYIADHPEDAIVNKNGEPFSHNGSYWPSAYKRNVWEFNVELAKEAVTDVGFNEIQFDYVRFPDRTGSLEKNGDINLGNIYNEDKANALQQFVIYACDEIHNVGAYVSIDVFGESASNYVTAYGQFWPAISNVADVISGMPYPDHFNKHEYGISEVVWTVPYKILNEWSKEVVSKQEIIPTPATVRTWIQTYNTRKFPQVVYDSDKVSEEIKALYDNGLTGGFMTWNSSSNLLKYKEISYSFRKVY